MKTMLLVVCLGVCAAGCGSGKVVSAANNVVMKGGQWEYVVTPDNGGIVMDIDANVPGTNVQFNGTNAIIFQPSLVGPNGPTSSTSPLYCSPFAINGEINVNLVKGNFDWADTTERFANFSGELSADGQSITNGSYSGTSCNNGSGPGTPGPNLKGTFTGYTIAPANGTYTGTLHSSLYGADVVTLVITQNADFSLNVSGTSVENGVTTVFASATNLPTGTGAAAVTGATVSWGGAAQNVNGSQSFQFSGHLNPAATQLTATLFQVGPNEWVTGTLTRQ
jgi:hypothetical protein